MNAVSRRVAPVVVYNNPIGYTTWMNPVAQASLANAAGGNNGSWMFGTAEGDPSRSEDNFHRLVKLARAYLYIADRDDEIQVGHGGSFSVQPYLDVNTQTGGYTWNVASTSGEHDDISVECKLQLVRDVLKWEYIIRNNTTTARRIGFRVLEDIQFPPNENVPIPYPEDEGPFYLPGHAPVTTATEIKKSQIIAQSDMEWSIAFPKLIDSGTGEAPYWKARQPLTNGVTVPNRIVFGPTTEVQNYSWDWIEFFEQYNLGWQIVNWGDPLDWDTTVGLYYDITNLGFSQTRVIRGQIQMDWAKVTTREHLALGVRAPVALDFRVGDNPDTPEVEDGYYDPYTFEVEAFASNSSLLTDPAVSLSIEMSDELMLAPGEVKTQSTDRIDPLEDRRFVWRVQVKGNAGGLAWIRVLGTYSPGGLVSSTTYINIPALPQRALNAGTHFISFPFTFANADASIALGLGPQTLLAWWDTTTASYRDIRYEDIYLNAGRSYWLKLDNATLLQLQNAAPVNQRVQQQITLTRGWNAISNPYLYSIEWGKCHVYYNYGDYSIEEAVRRGLLRAEIWAWDAGQSQYLYPQSGYAVELRPYTGYWLWSNDTVTLVYTPDPFVAAMAPTRTPEPSRRAGTAEDWRVNIVTEAGEIRDPLATFGVSSGDSDGPSQGDVMKPPISPAGLSAAFVHQDWGRASGQYAIDLRAPGAQKSWTLEVTCTPPNTQVTLRWPDLTQTPSGLPLLLTDQVSGEQVYMRTAPCYRFNSGSGGTRRFTITAGGTMARLAFTQTQVVPLRTRGSVTLTYGITVPADVRIVLRTPTGRIVRQFASTRSAAGTHSLQWDGRDQAGRLLPMGTYLCEFYAEAGDGQRTRASLVLRTR
jgi:hypothetical protein